MSFGGPVNNLASLASSTGYGLGSKFNSQTCFPTFKVKFRAALSIHKAGLDKVIDYEESSPNEADDKKAYNILVSCVDDLTLPIIIPDSPSCRAAFKTLQKTCVGNAEEIAGKSLITLCDVKRNEDETPAHYCARIRTLWCNSKAHNLKDAFVVNRAINGLADELRTQLRVLDTPATRPSFEDFECILRTKEEQLKSGSIVHINSHRSQKHPGKTCTNCKKFGHHASQCRRKCTSCGSKGHWTVQCQSRSHSGNGDVVAAVNSIRNPTPTQGDAVREDFAFIMQSGRECAREEEQSQGQIYDEDLHTQNHPVVHYHRSSTNEATFSSSSINLQQQEFSRGYQRWSANASMTAAPLPKGAANASPRQVPRYQEQQQHHAAQAFWLPQQQAGAAIASSHPPRQQQSTPHSRPATAPEFVVDSGCSSHVVTDYHLMKNISVEPGDEHHVLTMADGTQSRGVVRGKGEAQFLCRDSKDQITSIVLKNVLYIPSFKRNLISVQQGIEHEMTFNFSRRGSQIVSKSGASLNMVNDGGLFKLKVWRNGEDLLM